MVEDALNSVTELPWPRKGDILFDQADDWYHNACLNWRYDNWELYASGYKTAADILVQYVVDTRSERDTLVFPIVFNYRQYLELRCKEIIYVGRVLSDEPAEFPLTVKSLPKVNPARPRPILKRSMNRLRSSARWMLNLKVFVIRWIEKGTARFPMTFACLMSANYDVMNRVASFFDGVSMAFSAYLDYKADMESPAW